MKVFTFNTEQPAKEPAPFRERLKALERNTPKNRRRALELLNERHFTIRVGNKYAVCDVMATDVAVLPQRPSDFRLQYLPYKYGAAQKPLGDLWLNGLSRRSYDGVLVFKPEGATVDEGADDYNTWRGFRLKPKPGNWSLFRQHLKDVVCRGNDAYFNYLLDYFAHMVQYPGRLPGVALVIRGMQGTGKTIIYKMFELLFHPFNAVLVEDPQRITGHFNWHLADKILVCADEALFARNQELPGILKSRISAEKMLFEPKGVDAINLHNYVRLIIISNHEHVFHAEADERRYFVLETAETYAQRPGDSETAAAARRKAYFDPISMQMLHDGGAEAMMHDLQHRNLSAFDPRIFPETPFLARQKELSRQPHEQWWADKLERGGEWFEQPPAKGHVFQDWVDYANRHRFRHVMKDWQIAQFLIGLYGPGIATHRERRNGKQITVYVFPPLAEARGIFQNGLPKRTAKLTIRKSRTLTE